MIRSHDIAQEIMLNPTGHWECVTDNQKDLSIHLYHESHVILNTDIQRISSNNKQIIKHICKSSEMIWKRWGKCRDIPEQFVSLINFSKTDHGNISRTRKVAPTFQEIRQEFNHNGELITASNTHTKIVTLKTQELTWYACCSQWRYQRLS